jgi:hypothetical protein
MRKDRLRREFESFRKRKSIKCIEMERLARKLGRTRDPRGSEPTWVNLNFPKLFPLSIPHHGELNPYTAKSILNMLEEDLVMIEEST